MKMRWPYAWIGFGLLVSLIGNLLDPLFLHNGIVFAMGMMLPGPIMFGLAGLLVNFAIFAAKRLTRHGAKPQS